MVCSVNLMGRMSERGSSCLLSIFEFFYVSFSFSALPTIRHWTLDHSLRCHLTTKVSHRKLQSVRMYLGAAGRGPPCIRCSQRRTCCCLQRPAVAHCWQTASVCSPHNCLNDHEGQDRQEQSDKGWCSTGDVSLAHDRMQMTSARHARAHWWSVTFSFLLKTWITFFRFFYSWVCILH